MEIEMESDDLTTHLSEGMISLVDSALVLDWILSADIVQRRFMPYIELEDDDESDENDENGKYYDSIITFYMDIREPLRSLHNLLEQSIGVDLKGYVFWLQNAQALELDKNLVDQFVMSEGVVQIKLELQIITQRINIVDVLEPTDAVLEALVAEGDFPKTINADSENINING